MKERLYSQAEDELQLSFEHQHVLTEILEAYRNNPSNSNKYRYQLFAQIDEYLNAYTTNKIIEELERFEFVDWESYGDKPKEKYDDGLNILIDPLVENYVNDRIAELRKTL